MKNFMIFGDSYSTHKDHIPSGYAYYYCDEGRDVETPVTKMCVEKTWWGRLAKKAGANVVLNDSWSGSTIGYTGYEGDCSTSSSFIYRYTKLLEAGFFDKNQIDTIFVFGGTNDSWSNAPLGQEKYSGFEREELFSVMPAICYFAKQLNQNHPDTKVIYIANCDIKTEIVDCLRHVAERFGAGFVELHGIDKEMGHPTVLGMEQICEQVLERVK